MKLHLGCGNDYKKGYINADINRNYIADMYFNFNKFPYPFPEDFLDEIEKENVLEHLGDPIAVLKELTRISN